MFSHSTTRFTVFSAVLLSLVSMAPFSFAQEDIADRPNSPSLHLRSLPMERWLREGTIAAVTSPHDIGEIEAIFDGDQSTVLRSAQVNPQQTTVQFEDAISLSAVRVLTSDPQDRWKIEGFVWEKDAPHPIKREIVEWTNVEVGASNLIILPRNLSVTELTLTVERIGDDAHVHLHEWELFSEVGETLDKAPP